MIFASSLITLLDALPSKGIRSNKRNWLEADYGYGWLILSKNVHYPHLHLNTLHFDRLKSKVSPTKRNWHGDRGWFFSSSKVIVYLSCAKVGLPYLGGRLAFPFRTAEQLLWSSVSWWPWGQHFFTTGGSFSLSSSSLSRSSLSSSTLSRSAWHTMATRMNCPSLFFINSRHAGATLGEYFCFWKHVFL